MKSIKHCIEIGGSLWFEKSGHRYLDSERIKLLEKVGEVGSITKAAMAVGISYKTAWDRINLINSLADMPVVERLTGGRGGGGTTLTQNGKRIISQFRVVQEEHRKYLDIMEERYETVDRPVSYWRMISKKVTRR